MPLEANLFFLISTLWPILPYQLDTIPEVDIPKPYCKSKTTSLSLSLLLFLSTLLLICFQVFQPKQDTSYANYNHEFQPEIDLFWNLNYHLRLKLKVALLVPKIKDLV